MINNYITYQLELLDLYQHKFPDSELPVPIKEAFLHTPRHLFVNKYSVDGYRWRTVDHNNLATQLSTLYADMPLVLFDNGPQISTISQPTFVLKMLELLEVLPGHKVFELGAGSGWNAALLGQLVGTEGKVISLEIIDEMYRRAKKNIEQLDLRQVEILSGDAGKGYEEEAPYDRGIFTAGAYDIPHIFYQEIKDGGKLLFVLKTPSRGDLLLVLRKVNGHFEEEQRIHCSFVPVVGANAPASQKEMDDVLSSDRLSIYPKQDVPDIAAKIIQGTSSTFVLH